MEKNTILAIILSALVLFVGTYISQMINERNPSPPAPIEQTADDVNEEVVREKPTEKTTSLQISDMTEDIPDQNFEAKTIVEETDYYRIVFNTAGAIVSDLDLTQELDEEVPISMVLDGKTDTGTFNMAFGGTDVPYIRDVFDHKRIRKGNQIIHQFSRNYLKDGQLFSLEKSYRIIPGEYIVELRITLQTPDGKAVPLINPDQPAYTLVYGPQIGPVFEQLNRYEIRKNVSWGPDPKSGKFKREVHQSRRGKEPVVSFSNTVNWAGIIGKYFAVIVNPGIGNPTITWDGRPVEGQKQPSQLMISQPARRESVIDDIYQFYIGPLGRDQLKRYDNAEDNAFGISGMALQQAPQTSSWLGWLQSILRVLLEFFHSIIPNYGVAIILLTILVKAILYPFTHKSYQSTSKMQAIQPKLKEIQEQYKGDSQKINAKTAELYKSEGVNPMGGCLPMLFQFPIFISLYGLLNTYFPLRGATFIPGWITDLSVPEYVWREFETPINLLIIDIPAIRILPVLYLGGQLLMTKVMQQGSTGMQSGMQQKMLTLGMPIMFFFILYNMPSGLLLYWTAMNLITIGQQLVTNYIKKQKTIRGTE